MELLVIAILLSVASAQEGQFEGPQNTLSVAGSNVTLKCVSPNRNCSQLDWTKYSTGSPMTVSRNGGITATYRERYSIDNSSGCDLLIKNVELTDAGKFICSAIISGNTPTKSAYLIILQTQPKCTIDASLDDTVEGDGVRLTCELTYNGTNRPSMIWKGVEDAPAAVENRKTISRSYSVVASATGIPSFTCATSFALETKDYDGREYKGFATNNISVATCATPAIHVLYSIKDVTLLPSFSNYPSGTVISCAAKGHPPPTFKWQEKETNCVWMDIQNQRSSEFTMPNVSSKRYRCVAMNVVRAKSYNATSDEFQVNNAEFKDNQYSTLSSTSEDRLGIGIGIGVGIGLLITILLATVASAILIRLKYIDLHLRPANKPLDGDAQNMDHEMRSSSSHHRSAKDRSIPRTEAPIVGEQESAYASLGGDRDANEYAALELRQKTKPKK